MHHWRKATPSPSAIKETLLIGKSFQENALSCSSQDDQEQHRRCPEATELLRLLALPLANGTVNYHNAFQQTAEVWTIRIEFS